MTDLQYTYLTIIYVMLISKYIASKVLKQSNSEHITRIHAATSKLKMTTILEYMQCAHTVLLLVEIQTIFDRQVLKKPVWLFPKSEHMQ